MARSFFRVFAAFTLWLAVAVGVSAQVIQVPGTTQVGTQVQSVTLDVTADNAFRIQMSTPGSVTATPGAAGTLNDGTYAFRLVAVDEAGGTSLAGAEATCVTVAGPGAGSCALSWAAVTGAVSYRIYGSAVGAEDRYQTSTGLSYTWTTAGGATVAALPASNTAYRTNLGGSVNWFAAALKLHFQNLATTATDGVVLANNTAATAAVPVQQSPDLRIRSNVWNTTVTAANNTNDWIIRSVPASGATPSGLLKFGSSLNGAATTFPMTLTSGGTLAIGNSLISSADFAIPVNWTIGASFNASPSMQFLGGMTGASNPNGGLRIFNNTSYTNTSLGGQFVDFVVTFAPGSGSATWAAVQINPTINGTSSGIAYGLGIASKTNTLTGGKIKLLSVGTTTTDLYTGYTEVFSVSTTGVGIGAAGVVAISATAPTITSGFGTTPSIVASNGTAAFTVNIGTGGTATGGVLTLPTATTGWACRVENLTAVAANRGDQRTAQTATTTTSVTVQNQTVSTGAALAWTASDVLQLSCLGY